MAIGTLIVYALAVTAALVWMVHSAKGSGAVGTEKHTSKSMPTALTAAPGRCPHARIGVAFYRGRYADHRDIRGLETPYPAGRKPRSCADAHYLAELWPERSFQERQITEQWIEDHTLFDFEVRPGNQAWYKGISEAQKVFPGTDGILLSCSTSEGGHGRWVRHGGGAYYSGYRGVGGWMQFLPGTFERHFAAALEVAKSKDFRVPKSAHSWFSALGQALAGAWGLTYSRGEWSGAGC